MRNGSAENRTVYVWKAAADVDELFTAHLMNVGPTK